MLNIIIGGISVKSDEIGSEETAAMTLTIQSKSIKL